MCAWDEQEMMTWSIPNYDRTKITQDLIRTLYCCTKAKMNVLSYNLSMMVCNCSS